MSAWCSWWGQDGGGGAEGGQPTGSSHSLPLPGLQQWHRLLLQIPAIYNYLQLHLSLRSDQSSHPRDAIRMTATHLCLFCNAFLQRLACKNRGPDRGSVRRYQEASAALMPVAAGACTR